MLTVLESIQLSTEYLGNKGIVSPRTNAELLLAHILNCKRLDLYLQFDRPLSEEDKNKYREFISRRGKFEPLQYITGKVEFYGLTFHVNRSVLIPRQETEILVELVINETFPDKQINILDIGSGSGVIPICLSKHLTKANIISIDASEEAITLSKQNAELNDCSEKIKFMQVDIFDDNQINSLGKFDMIVSNPPYVSIDEFESLQPEIKFFEPKNAVTDFDSGFLFYHRIVELTNRLLNPKGKLYFEVGEGKSESVVKIMESKNFINIKIQKDYLHIERVIYGELI